MKALLRRAAEEKLPASFDVDTHFAPRYDPWDQRLCAVPGGDLFRAISAGDADVVTDRIDHIDAHGIQLVSGARLDADVIVTATGLNVLVLGGMRIDVDGRAIDPGATLAYKGMMLTGVPNLAYTIGYTNSSWTLRADLVADAVARTAPADAPAAAPVVVPQSPAHDGPTAPVIDLAAGYISRGMHLLPRQGHRSPWKVHQNYLRDLVLFRFDPRRRALRFQPARSRA